MTMTAAERVWVACAELHLARGNDATFSVVEIRDAATKIPGPQNDATLAQHAGAHCVGNRWPKNAQIRMLFQTPDGNRRLWRAGDSSHPARRGPHVPHASRVPARYHDLLAWWQEEYSKLPGQNYVLREEGEATAKAPAPTAEAASPPVAVGKPMTGRDFEDVARPLLEKEFGVRLRPRTIPHVPKTFDFVSDDLSIIGDAKYFSRVRGVATPPAKNSVIAEYCWLLQSIPARRRFLVFGNDRRVPEAWIGKHGHLVRDIEFWFVDGAKRLDRIDK